MIICQVFLARDQKKKRKKKSYCSVERRNCCVANVLSKQMTSKHMAKHAVFLFPTLGFDR